MLIIKILGENNFEILQKKYNPSNFIDNDNGGCLC